ncbi:MAG TPA: DinB family protein [Bryobacteraceae bacterium]|nr:DinB family protein [Bryobacteraceae bacterium]
MELASTELARTVEAAETVLRQVSEAESERPALPGGWSRKQLLGHLIDSASNNHQRFVRAALAAGELEFPGYDTSGCVRIQAVEAASWSMLVDLWACYNRYLVHVIRHLPGARLDAVCRIGSNAPVSLRFLVEDYLRHLLHHLDQIGAAREP